MLASSFCPWLLEEEFHKRRGNFKGNSFSADPAHWIVCSVCASDFFCRTLYCVDTSSSHNWFYIPKVTTSQELSCEHIERKNKWPTELQFTCFLIWTWVNCFLLLRTGKKGNRVFWRGRGLCVKKLSLTKYVRNQEWARGKMELQRVLSFNRRTYACKTHQK